MGVRVSSYILWNIWWNLKSSSIGSMLYNKPLNVVNSLLAGTIDLKYKTRHYPKPRQLKLVGKASQFGFLLVMSRAASTEVGV